MSDLPAFLLARYAEEEALAVEFDACEWGGVDAWGEGTDLFFGDLAPASVERVLADVKAKRRIVEQACAWNETGHRQGTQAIGSAVRALAAIYADHPDYDKAWV